MSSYLEPRAQLIGLHPQIPILRKKRITSSIIGAVFRRRPTLKVTPLVRRMLYGTFSGNQYTRHGLTEERSAIPDYETFHNQHGSKIKVKPSGLVIDMKYPWMACSPDGVVTEQGKVIGLVEVKNLLKNKSLTLRETASKVKGFWLEVCGKNLQLKNGHDYFYLCPGQMQICDLPWVDFVVRSTNPHQLHVERLYRDNNWWESTVIPKLKAFYDVVLLPELACPRDGKEPGIREPTLPWVGSFLKCGQCLVITGVVCILGHYNGNYMHLFYIDSFYVLYCVSVLSQKWSASPPKTSTAQAMHITSKLPCKNL